MKLTWKNRSARGKTCHSATLPTTNPTRTDPGSNPGLCGERPVTNRLSHGTAMQVVKGQRLFFCGDLDGRFLCHGNFRRFFKTAKLKPSFQQDSAW